MASDTKPNVTVAGGVPAEESKALRGGGGGGPPQAPGSAVASTKAEAALGTGPNAVGTQQPNAGQQQPVRKISALDIQLVQNLIERCLQLYMTRKEVVSTLQHQARIEPGFTSLVWQKLEEQNPDFFRAYYTRLKVKDQMELFNTCLEYQAQLLQKSRPMNQQMAGPTNTQTMPALPPKMMHHPQHMQNGHVMAPMQYPMQGQMGHPGMQHPGVAVNGMMMPPSHQQPYPMPNQHHLNMEQQYGMQTMPNGQRPGEMHGMPMHPHPVGSPGPYGQPQMYPQMGGPHQGYDQHYSQGGQPGMGQQGRGGQHPGMGGVASSSGMPHTMPYQMHPQHQHPHMQQQMPHQMMGAPHQQQQDMGMSMQQQQQQSSQQNQQQQNPQSSQQQTQQQLHQSQNPGSMMSTSGLQDSQASNPQANQSDPSLLSSAYGSTGNLQSQGLPSDMNNPENSLLAHLPTNFSLTDLSLELSNQLNDGPAESPLALFSGGGLDGGLGEDPNKTYRLPRNFSLSDMTLDFEN